jgi:putative endonuclease
MNRRSQGKEMAYRQKIGRWGEDRAVEYLEHKGIHILARNVRNSYGELDIIGQYQSTIIFFEVKTRTSDEFGMPETSITPKKQEHLSQSAQAYMQAHEEFKGDWRVDIIALRGKPGGGEPEIQWFENALSQK